MPDLIERQAAIDAVNDLPDCPNGFSDVYDKAHIISVIEEVPSVQPERKKGRWITHVYKINELQQAYCECTVCGSERPVTLFPLIYCPNCGSYNGRHVSPRHIDEVRHE